MAYKLRKNINKITLMDRIKPVARKLMPDRLMWVYRKLKQKPDQPQILQNSVFLRQYDIGDWSNGYLSVYDTSKGNLKIGKFCSFARGCSVSLGGEHRPDWVTTYHIFHHLGVDFKRMREDVSATRGAVEIGHDVWCGAFSSIMSGVKIGNGAIIGAHSVVRRDIPPYAIVLGNPARLTGYRFSPEIIEKLQAIAWWDWPIEKIKEAYPLLLSEKIDEFISKYE